MHKLDLKDKKILYELDTNSRQSSHEIAKKTGLSKDSVIYRINKLQENGIIEQFHTVMDVGKLGFISFRLYLKFQNTTPKKEKEIIEFLKKQKIITWIVSIEGDYDLGMWILTKSIKEMNELWKTLLKKYVNYIEKRWLTIFTKVSYFPRAYFIDKKHNDKEYIFITEPEEIKIDKVDLEILKILAYNSRVNIIDISEKLKITPKTISTRIKHLEKKKIIIGYRTKFDLEKLGYQYFKVHFNLHNLKEKKENEFKSYLKQNPNIIYDNEVLGGDDLEIEVQVKSLKELREIIKEMKNKFSEIIKNYRYMLFYKEHKFLFFPS
ncbi:Lrp/AsnC family transcriptional regulator [archaeon]|jgi:Lrp/AsnC family transcriptional regulator, leucine-responsive regulatory protein|nr:Lrp/AsnC family transcriptional regulator [archaeon]